MISIILDSIRHSFAGLESPKSLGRPKQIVCGSIAGAVWIALASLAMADERPSSSDQLSFRILPTGQMPADQRRTQSRTIISGHRFTPPTSIDEWNQRREEVRTRILVANGLWPMPNRPAVQAIVHGKIEKNGYSIEKVYFESLPGHFVCGNLYRPLHAKGKWPAVLFPHGHFGNGRLYEAPPDEVTKQIAGGGESFEQNARYPTQAVLITLARHGYVVFQHDMVGRGDSQAIAHAKGFDDAEGLLRLQSAMGLQTWNSLRALDFVCGLEEVDVRRVGVTGPSGGGTQTILLCAIDDRPACAFPAVMVSESMQGGCACENAPLLRIGGGNVEIAALFAPKPLGMTNANDWTLHFEKKSFPDLQSLYRLYSKPENVQVRRFPQFKHNFNQVSREVMYAWMNEHLARESEAIKEEPIDPVLPAQLSVFDQLHRVEWSPIEKLRVTQTDLAEKQLRELEPQTVDDLHRLQNVLSRALHAMTATKFPSANELDVRILGQVPKEEYHFERMVLSRTISQELFANESVPAGCFLPAKWNGDRMVVWVDPRGHEGLLDESKTVPRKEVLDFLRDGVAVLSPDVLLTGEFLARERVAVYPKVSMENPRFTLTYNRSIMAQRVHDVLSAVGCAKFHYHARTIDLIGFAEGGPWVILARALAGESVRRTAADVNHFSFTSITDRSDPSLLPGALKYGDLLGLARVIAPAELFLQNAGAASNGRLKALTAAYALSQSNDRLRVSKENEPLATIFEWLNRPE